MFIAVLCLALLVAMPQENIIQAHRHRHMMLTTIAVFELEFFENLPRHRPLISNQSVVKSDVTTEELIHLSVAVDAARSVAFTGLRGNEHLVRH